MVNNRLRAEEVCELLDSSEKAFECKPLALTHFIKSIITVVCLHDFCAASRSPD